MKIRSYHAQGRGYEGCELPDQGRGYEGWKLPWPGTWLWRVEATMPMDVIMKGRSYHDQEYGYVAEVQVSLPGA
jgi:hypothetical protein